MREPLLFLPGMMCDARLFGPQIATFSVERMVAVAPLTGAATIPDLARRILADAPPLFALAGLSMGGIVAMEMIAQAPTRISRLALLDTNPKAESDAVAAARAPQIEAVQSGQLHSVMRDQMKPNYLTDGPHRDAILDLCMEMAETLGPQTFVAQSRALMSRGDQQATLRDVRVATLILCGRHDALCPVHRHTLMRDLVPGATLEIIENAGHLPTLEQPEATTRALRQWLAT